MWLLDKALGRLVTRGELVVTDSDNKVRRYGTPDPELGRIAVRFHDARVARDLVRNTRLAAAEAYMDGRLTFDEGDILGLILLVGANRPWERRGPPSRSLPGRIARGLARLVAPNDAQRSKRNVAHHYDIGNALYRLFLDEDMQYSCAYFTDPEAGLEQAQRDKKAHIAAKLHLKPGQKVLDIGCGWGGMALYLHRHFDVDVLGVTLSEEQLELARARARAAGVADRVRFELIDYRAVEGPFDRIVSVGMFEHVGAEHHDTFFRKCRSLLTEDGVMLLHTIGRFDVAKSGEAFASKYIFPGYHLPNLSQLVSAAERARLINADVETLRLHYARTLMHWMERTRAHRDEIVAMCDERFFRMWEVYLAGAMAMFRYGAGCVFQVQLARSRNALPITRDYMFEGERALTAAPEPAVEPVEPLIAEPALAAE